MFLLYCRLIIITEVTDLLSCDLGRKTKSDLALITDHGALIIVSLSLMGNADPVN